MSRSLLLGMGASLLTHGAVAAFFLLPRAHTPTAMPSDPPPANAGETFELPAPEAADVPLANASPSVDTPGEAHPAEAPDAPTHPSPPLPSQPGRRASREGRPSAGRTAPSDQGTSGGSGSAALYGAVGDRTATDIVRAVRRDFPQAASADPLWRTAPLGSAGHATLVLTLDEAGKIANVEVKGHPPPALASGIRRTIALMKGRAYTARTRVTELRLSATITSDMSAGDGLRGEVFAVGQGFFAINVGRRIDIDVRVQ